MIDSGLRRVPAGAVDVTAPPPPAPAAAAPGGMPAGLEHIDPDDPSLTDYRVIANNRQPVALRDIMIQPVRTGYIGADRVKPDPSLIPPTGAEAVPDVDVDDVYLPVRDGVARCQVYRPRSADPEAALPIVLYFHGGGFTVGSSDDTDYLTRRLAVETGALVVSANYRLAPEHRFPVPLDDAFDVYLWLRSSGGRIGGEPSRIAVAGDSAGSNFAAALPIRARDEGAPLPEAVVMLGAFADFRAERWESFQRLAPDGIVYDSAFFGFIRGAYLGATDWAHPWASPIDAELEGYPPTFITAGTHDPIVDSARAFADRLREAGTSVTATFPEGLPHGYYLFPAIHPREQEEAYRMAAQTVVAAFGGVA